MESNGHTYEYQPDRDLFLCQADGCCSAVLDPESSAAYDYPCAGRPAAVAIREFEAQPTLQPGDEGWWKVWGASPDDIKAGDIVLVKDSDGNVETLFIEDTFLAKSVTRVGVVIDGERQTLGRLCPIILVRKGTRNTLARSIR
jgi:hypothetical protein